MVASTRLTLAMLLGKGEIPKPAPMPSEELRALIMAAQAGDTEARDRVILQFLRFASKQIHKIAPARAAASMPELLVAAAYGHPPGENGLIRAVAKFDPSKAGFMTYAAHWIRAAAQAALRAEAPTARSAWRAAKAKRTRARLEAQFGEVSDAEVARVAKVSQESIAAGRIRHVSLDHAPAADDYKSELFEALQNRKTKDLHPLAAEVIKMRYLEDAKPIAVAQRLGITLDDVARHEHEGLAALRKHLEHGASR
jgi:RNA polymerase sigma factor (sigma-70 family)